MCYWREIVAKNLARFEVECDTRMLAHEVVDRVAEVRDAEAQRRANAQLPAEFGLGDGDGLLGVGDVREYPGAAFVERGAGAGQ